MGRKIRSTHGNTKSERDGWVNTVTARLSRHQFANGGIFHANRSAHLVASDAVDALVESGDLVEKDLEDGLA